MKKVYDIVVIGGGIIGSSISYNLVNDGFDGDILVIEKDPTYEFASKYHSAPTTIPTITATIIPKRNNQLPTFLNMSIFLHPL